MRTRRSFIPPMRRPRTRTLFVPGARHAEIPRGPVIQAGVAPEWKSLLHDLDRLQQVRIRHRGNHWVVRTDVAKPIADLSATPHRDAAARQQMAPPKLVPPTIRSESSQSPQAWCHVIAILPKAA